jgi:hypothetical protein
MHTASRRGVVEETPFLADSYQSTGPPPRARRGGDAREEIPNTDTTPMHADSADRTCGTYYTPPGVLDLIGRIVATSAMDDGEPFEEKMQRLVGQLSEQQAEAAKLDAAIAAILRELGYGG